MANFQFELYVELREGDFIEDFLDNVMEVLQDTSKGATDLGAFQTVQRAVNVYFHRELEELLPEVILREIEEDLEDSSYSE